MTDNLSIEEAPRSSIKNMWSSGVWPDAESTFNSMEGFDVTSDEIAHRTASKTRKTVWKGLTLVITDGGRFKSLKKIKITKTIIRSAILMYNNEECHADERLADSVLAQLEPTGFDFADMYLSRRKHEEMISGRRRLF